MTTRMSRAWLTRSRQSPVASTSWRASLIGAQGGAVARRAEGPRRAVAAPHPWASGSKRLATGRISACAGQEHQQAPCSLGQCLHHQSALFAAQARIEKRFRAGPSGAAQVTAFHGKARPSRGDMGGVAEQGGHRGGVPAWRDMTIQGQGQAPGSARAFQAPTLRPRSPKGALVEGSSRMTVPMPGSSGSLCSIGQGWPSVTTSIARVWSTTQPRRRTRYPDRFSPVSFRRSICAIRSALAGWRRGGALALRFYRLTKPGLRAAPAATLVGFAAPGGAAGDRFGA